MIHRRIGAYNTVYDSAGVTGNIFYTQIWCFVKAAVFLYHHPPPSKRLPGWGHTLLPTADSSLAGFAAPARGVATLSTVTVKREFLSK